MQCYPYVQEQPAAFCCVQLLTGATKVIQEKVETALCGTCSTTN